MSERAIVCGTIFGALVSYFLYLEQRNFQFSNKVIILIGDASYAIYLTHFVAIAALRFGCESVGLVRPYQTVAEYGLLATALFASLLLGVGVHLFVERPLLKLCNNFRRQRIPLEQVPLK